MPATLAFDVYGTLVDTGGVIDALEAVAGDRAGEFSDTWRSKQLEYAFRRGLMRDYVDFSTCTRQALDYTCAVYGLDLKDRERGELMDVYTCLPAFTDVPGSLATLTEQGFRLYAFSNGSAGAVEQLLVNAGIRGHFLGVISVEAVQSFKPDPVVYEYFLRQSGALARESWLISGNPFDVLGAMNTGMNAAWLNRSGKAILDPWGIKPTLETRSLEALCTQLAGRSGDEGQDR